MKGDELTLDSLAFDDEKIPRFEVERTPWLEMFAKFCLRNEPCVLTEAFTAKWPARRQKPCDALQYVVDPRRMGIILIVMEKRFHDAATINARSGFGIGPGEWPICPLAN
ncbi:unnamed protein product [Nippostrongylus brasiliensis]|uniref:Transposase n=1 Tax=Nippostrongylus brasiliensis TaxID=27835 RepID=A0A158R2L6_NIPBR|nr:unnamed protein product [Nippostrongylus brasiliensis]